MDKIKSTVKNNIKPVCKILFLVILFFGLTFYMNMATDSFRVEHDGFKQAAEDMCTLNSRLIIGGLFYLGYLFGMSLETFYYFSAVLAVIFLTLSVWVYYKILLKHSISENVAIILSFEAVANLFIIEYFRFIEKGGFMMAIFFNVMGVYFIDLFFSDKKYKYLAYSVVMMILAAFTYQGTMALFVLLCLPLVNKYSSKIFDYIKNLFWVGMVYLTSVGVIILMLRFVFNSSRVVYESNIFDQLSYVGLVSVSLLNNPFSMLPQGLLLYVFFIMIAVYLISALLNKKLVRQICSLGIMIVFSIIFPSAPILQGTGYWIMRIVYPLASLLGIISIDYFFNNSETSGKSRKIMNCLIVFSAVIILVNQCITNNRIFIDAEELNALDKYRINYIGQRIEEYELTTGNTITQIAFYTDSETERPFYPDIYFYAIGDNMMDSALYKDWSDILCINYYLETDYTKSDSAQEYVDYFASRNWDELSDEQLIFEGNTLHLCLY